MFLIMTLILCIANYKKLYINFKYNRSLVFSIVCFSLWIYMIGSYHDSSMRELDNYFRLLILLPLLSLGYITKYFNITLLISTILAAIDFSIFYLNVESFSIRYQGTSGYPITYASILLFLSLISIYRSFDETNQLQKKLLVLSVLINIFITLFTQSLGPILSFITCLILILIYKRKYNYLLASIISILFLITLSPQLSSKMKALGNIDITNIMNNESRTIRERVGYIHYAYQRITSTYIYGIGPQNIEQDMDKYFSEKNIKYTRVQDHLHNEFLDITTKFGLAAMALLLIIYYLIYTSARTEKPLILLLIIYVICAQVTQSQFSHSQGITFFISFLYILSKSNNDFDIKREK